jgi:hypothetical protein
MAFVDRNIAVENTTAVKNDIAVDIETPTVHGRFRI